MPDSADENVAQLSQGAWIDQVADRFDAAWQAGSEPKIADFLSHCEGAVKRELLQELVAIDQEYRTKRGMAKAWQEYLTEFPELEFIQRTGNISEDTTQTRSPRAAVAEETSAPVGGERKASPCDTALVI